MRPKMKILMLMIIAVLVSNPAFAQVCPELTVLQ